LRKAPGEVTFMTPSRRALRAVPVALAAGLFLVAQKPATFTEQVEVREVELVVDLAGSLSRLKKETLDPGDLIVIEDGLVRPVTRVGPIAEGRIRSLLGRDEAIAQPDWTVVIWVDRVLAGPDAAFYASLALSKHAERLTGLGPVEVIVADPSPRAVLAPTREPKLVAQALTDLVAQAGRDRDKPSGNPGHPDLRAAGTKAMEELALQRQCERLVTGLTAARHGGPRLLLLVADGFSLTPAEMSLLGDQESGPESGRAAALLDAARLLAAYGWVTVPLPLHGEGPGILHQGRSDVDKLRMNDQGGGKYGNSVPPVIAPKLPKSSPLQWEGVAEMQVQPDMAPLRALVRETGGALAGFAAQLEPVLETIEGRWHLWFQAPDSRDGRLHSIQVRLRDGRVLRARRWLRSATPEALATARLHRLLGGEAPAGGDLPLRIEALRSTLRLTLAGVPGGADPAPAIPGAPPQVRVSLAFAGPGDSVVIRHETLPGITDLAEGWSRTVALPAAVDLGQLGQVAVVVEDLARERWTGALVRLPRQ
jgi:hypothetical protein